jgi:hypothetical protein
MRLFITGASTGDGGYFILDSHYRQKRIRVLICYVLIL